MIEKTMPIEELVAAHPQAAGFLLRRGVACLACGEAVWETLEAFMKRKGFNDAEIDALTAELNEYVERN